jgi:hypothetical protein
VASKVTDDEPRTGAVDVPGAVGFAGRLLLVASWFGFYAGMHLLVLASRTRAPGAAVGYASGAVACWLEVWVNRRLGRAVLTLQEWARNLALWLYGFGTVFSWMVALATYNEVAALLATAATVLWVCLLLPRSRDAFDLAELRRRGR